MKTNNLISKWTRWMITAAILGCIYYQSAYAVIPSVVDFQGYLTDLNGLSVTDDSYEIWFQLKPDSPDSVDPLWSEIHTVNVVNGIYQVRLGSITSFSDPDGNQDVSDALSFAEPYRLDIQVRKLGETNWDTIRFDDQLLPLASAWTAFRSKTSEGRLISLCQENCTLTDNQDIIFVSGNTRVTLPHAKQVPGRLYTIKKIDSEETSISIATINQNSIDGLNCDPDQQGSPLIISNKFEDITLVSDGKNWLKIGASSAISGNVKISDGSIDTDKLADNAVTTIKLADQSVTLTKMNLSDADIPLTWVQLEGMIQDKHISEHTKISHTKLDLEGIIQSLSISDYSIAYTKLNLRDDDIPFQKIASKGAIQNEDIADNASIDALKLNLNNAITTQTLANDAVTSSKIRDGAISTDDIGDQVITVSKLSQANEKSPGQFLMFDGSDNLAFTSEGQFNHLTVLNQVVTQSIHADNAQLKQLALQQIAFSIPNPDEPRQLTIPNTSGTLLLANNGSVGNADLSDNAVDSRIIANHTITNDDISDIANITYNKLLLINAIKTDDLIDGSVTYTKLSLAPYDVPYTMLFLTESIQSKDIVPEGIDYTKLSLDGLVNTLDIYDGTITNNDIADTTISPIKLRGITSLGETGQALLSSGGGDFFWDYASPLIKKMRDIRFSHAFGTKGLEDGQFNNPSGIAVDKNGLIYVACRTNHRVQIFTPEGVFIRRFGQRGSFDGNFNSPYGIAVDNDGYIYVADTNNHRIQKFSNIGTHLMTIGGTSGNGEGQFYYPYGVTIDRSNKIYVADSGNHRIQVFNAQGQFVGTFGSEGSEKGKFNFPYGVAVNLSGQIIVLDAINARVQVFDAQFNYLYMFGALGTKTGQFGTPYGLSVDTAGNIYVADTTNHRIQKFNNTGYHLLTFGTGIPGTNNGEFNYPYGVASDINGNIYVADTTNNRVQVFKSDLPIYSIATTGIGVNTTDPDESAIFHLESSTAGFLVPRMTKQQRDAIETPAKGLMVYQNNEVEGFYYYNGTSWRHLSNDLADNSVTSAAIEDSSIMATDIADNAILGRHIANDTLTSEDIQDNAIQSIDIKDGAITSAKIADATIQTQNIADASVTGAKIALQTLRGAHFVDQTITGDKIANQSITGDNIAEGTISSTHVGPGMIGSDSIGIGAITTDHIRDNAITALKLSDGAVTDQKLHLNAFQANSLTLVHTIAADTASFTNLTIAQTATLKPSSISPVLVTLPSKSGMIVVSDSGQISATNILNQAVTSQHIQDASITSQDIANQTITDKNLAVAKSGTLHQSLVSNGNGGFEWLSLSGILNILTVGEGGEYSTINDAFNAIQNNSSTHRYLIRVGPGIYNERVEMKPYVDIEGSGQNITIIRYSGNVITPALGSASATLIGANNATVRNMSIESVATGGTSYAVAMYNQNVSPTLSQINVVVSGASTESIGLYNSSSSPKINHVQFSITNSNACVGIMNSNASHPNMESVNIVCTGAMTHAYGCRNVSSSPVINRISITLTGGTNCYGILNEESAYPRLNDVFIQATSGTTSYGVNHSSNQSGKADIRNARITGTTNAVSVLSGKLLMTSSQIEGGMSIEGTAACYCADLITINGDTVQFYSNNCP